MSGLYFDRFDVCEAYYMFATEWHGGQNTKEYAIFGRLHKLQFRPRPLIDVETLNENAQLIYNGLVRRLPVRLLHKSRECVDFSESEGDALPVEGTDPSDIACAVCRHED